MVNLREVFEKYNHEYLEFQRVKNPPSNRPDLCALIIIDRLFPKPGRPIIDAAEHDEFWVAISPDRLAEVATEEDVLTLIRCGLRYSRESGGLVFFV